MQSYTTPRKWTIWLFRVFGVLLLAQFLMTWSLFTVIPLQIGESRIDGTLFGLIKSYRFIYAVFNVASIFILFFQSKLFLKIKKHKSLHCFVSCTAIGIIVCTILMIAIFYLSVGAVNN